MSKNHCPKHEGWSKDCFNCDQHKTIYDLCAELSEAIEQRNAQFAANEVLQSKLAQAHEVLEWIAAPSRWPSSYTWGRIANAMAGHAREALAMVDGSGVTVNHQPRPDTTNPKTGRLDHHCYGGTRGTDCLDYHASHERDKCDKAHSEKVSEKPD